MPAQLSAAEVEQHPEYPHVIWDLKPAKAGKVSVAADRGGPLNIAYEVHGRGPRLLVWIMGLGGLRSSWQRQTKDFAHTQADKYTSLVLDNRGIGESDKPFARYSTSEMARDVVELLEHVGWYSPERPKQRNLNVIGISLGGMISQELAVLIPESIATLTLVSTAARLVNTIGFLENLKNRAAMFIPKAIDAQLDSTKLSLYTPAFVGAPDALAAESVAAPFPTNGDRFAAMEIRKRATPGALTKAGFIAQAVAAGWHAKSADQLAGLARAVGRGRISVVHGTEDRMITIPHGRVLSKELGGDGEEVETWIVEGQGHVIPIELRDEFREFVERRVEQWYTE